MYQLSISKICGLAGFAKIISLLALVLGITGCKSDWVDERTPGEQREGSPEINSPDSDQSEDATQDAPPSDNSEDATQDAPPSDDSKQKQDDYTEESISKTGFYVIDGTNVDESNNSILYQIYDEINLTEKKYFGGPDLAGSNVRPIIEDAKSMICKHWIESQLDEIILMGYSRGAMMVVTVAQELTRKKSDDEDKWYCRNSGYREDINEEVSDDEAKPKIRWVGLLDAVNTLNYDLSDSMSGIGDCDHFVKKNEFEVVLTTKTIKSCKKEKNSKSTNHVGLSKSENADKFFRKKLEDIGIEFE